MANKKGLFYTLGLTFLGLLLLMLAVLFYREALAREGHTIELSFVQKWSNLDSSVKEVFSEAVLRESKIKITVANDSFTFTENFPHDFTNLNSLLQELKQNLEREFPNQLNLSINNFTTHHSLNFEPLNVSYEHIDAQTITIYDNASTIQSYNITLTLGENITDCNSEFQEGGRMSLSFLATSPGESCQATRNNLLRAEIKMDVKGNGVSLIWEKEKLTLQTNVSAESKLTANFENLRGKGTFTLPLYVTLSDPTFNFSRTSAVFLS